MTVKFDEVSGHWRVVGHDGTVYEDGFTNDAAAWKWVDEHSNSKMDDTRQRISNAIRGW